MSPVAQQFAHICPAASSQSQSEEPFSLWNVFSLPLSPALACFWGTVAIGSHRCVMVMAGPVHRHTASVGRGSGYGSAQSPAGGLPSEIGVIRATSSPEAWALVHTHPGSWQNPGGYAPGGTSQHSARWVQRTILPHSHYVAHSPGGDTGWTQGSISELRPQPDPGMPMQIPEALN